MFLRKFSEIQKKGFWDLANMMVLADGEVVDSERKLLNEYKIELGHTEFEIGKFDTNIKKTISSMKLNEKEKKELMFELIGVAYSDNNFDITERKILQDIQKELKLSDKEVSIIGKFVNSVLNIYSLIGEYFND